jgi:hypothetical protein
MYLLRISIVSFALCWNTLSVATAAEFVQFEGARLQTSLTASQKIASGIPLFPSAPQLVLGYIQKPDGPGPFPSIIVLHGCAGLGSLFNPHLAHNFWPDLLVSWGYAVLVVDSFVTRGLRADPESLDSGTMS